MKHSNISLREIREFIANGGLEKTEPSLEAVELSPDAKLITEAQVLTPGIAWATLIYYTANDASDISLGKPILFYTSCSDINFSSIDSVAGIIVSIGDSTSHIVLRARALSIPVVRVDEAKMQRLQAYSNTVVTVVAGQGKAFIIAGEGKLRNAKSWESLSEMARVTKPYRSIEVRANIDNYIDAAKAYSAGADGIGMWRTENFLLNINRGKALRQLLLDILYRPTSVDDNSLEEVVELMASELLLILRVVQGTPLVVRLLDLPLVEMLTDKSDLETLTFNPSNALNVKNPLLSVRGARLGIVFPKIAVFQLRAIDRAIQKAATENFSPNLHILVPFVTHASEVTWYRNTFADISHDVLGKSRSGIAHIKFGANIETPRAAITADSIATVSDFFSFGTNDLTQYTWAIDRDSGASEMIDSYLSANVLSQNPFAHFDYAGVGLLMEQAVEKGRKSNSKLVFGVTGNFGSHIEMVNYFARLEINYVGVPIALIPIIALAYARQYL